MSRETLISAYVAALPFSPVAVLAIPGGGCRVETAAAGVPARTSKRLVAQQYYFRSSSHIELVLGAAGLAEGQPIDEEPDSVAALIRSTARRMGSARWFLI